MKLKLHLLLFYPSTRYICDFFQFHIEIKGKGGWIIGGGGGGGAEGMLAPPSQIIGGGAWPPLPPPSSYAYAFLMYLLKTSIVSHWNAMFTSSHATSK